MSRSVNAIEVYRAAQAPPLTHSRHPGPPARHPGSAVYAAARRAHAASPPPPPAGSPPQILGQPLRRNYPAPRDQQQRQHRSPSRAAQPELPEGLLSQVTRAVLERALAEEMTGHLGYAKHDPAGRGSGNSRNGTTGKTVLTGKKTNRSKITPSALGTTGTMVSMMPATTSAPAAAARCRH
jgi:Transposase, Mutator family